MVPFLNTVWLSAYESAASFYWLYKIVVLIYLTSFSSHLKCIDYMYHLYMRKTMEIYTPKDGNENLWLYSVGVVYRYFRIYGFELVLIVQFDITANTHRRLITSILIWALVLISIIYIILVFSLSCGFFIHDWTISMLCPTNVYLLT